MCVVANGNKMQAIRYAYVLTNNEFFQKSTTNIYIHSAFDLEPSQHFCTKRATETQWLIKLHRKQL